MKINPYYINKDLRKKGWKCDDTGVYIPYESQDGSMYLKISKKEKFFRYETFKKGNTNPNASHSIMRSTNMENDIKYDNGERVNLSPYGTPNFLKEKILINFLGTLGFRKVMGIKGTELFIKKLLNDIKDSGCLEILTDQYYYIGS
jgi:hypothetical protein